MKSQRHQMIIKLVSEEKIDTQESLQAALAAHGFKVTQATVSRDIKDLSLIKVVLPDGSYKYRIPSLRKNGLKEENSAIMSFISDSVLSVDYAGNTVVVKCHSGMAQAVCAKLDRTKLENVVGTLAGDDTIFILMRTESDAQRLVKELNSIIYSK